MDNARRKLRVCLICVVMAAVVIGLIYYLNDMRGKRKINEGTLVKNVMYLNEENWQATGSGTDGMWGTAYRKAGHRYGK